MQIQMNSQIDHIAITFIVVVENVCQAPYLCTIMGRVYQFGNPIYAAFLSTNRLMIDL